MIRSLLAAIVAVIAGFATAKMVEGGGAVLWGAQAGSLRYQLLLAAGWFAGSFVAAYLALYLGRRWAPLGAVAASAIFLGAAIALLSNPLNWMLWPAAMLATGLGGYGAIKVMKAPAVYPEAKPKTGLFDE